MKSVQHKPFYEHECGECQQWEICKAEHGEVSKDFVACVCFTEAEKVTA